MRSIFAVLFGAAIGVAIACSLLFSYAADSIADMTDSPPTRTTSR